MAKIDSAETNELLSILRNVIFFIAIYLYFIGWLFAYYLFYHFGISLNSVDIPFYYFFVYSYSVFVDKLLWFIGALILIIMINLIPSKLLKKWLITLVLILIFPLFFYLAKESADIEALNIRMGSAKTIKLFFKKDVTKYYPKDFIDANKKDALKLLIQTNDIFYVFYQPVGAEKEIPFGFTYAISKSDIHLAAIEMQNIQKIGRQ